MTQEDLVIHKIPVIVNSDEDGAWMKDKVIILREKYLELLKEYTNTKGKLIIDKVPLHTSRLPLINLLFPNAKIIFTHRHPYDTVLSCFQQSFKPNSAMANLVSLKSSSIMYDQVMNAWDIYKNNLPLDFITSKYEHLIEDFDRHTLKILDFLGIGWDANVKNLMEMSEKSIKCNQCTMGFRKKRAKNVQLSTLVSPRIFIEKL